VHAFILAHSLTRSLVHSFALFLALACTPAVSDSVEHSPSPRAESRCALLRIPYLMMTDDWTGRKNRLLNEEGEANTKWKWGDNDT
jgi:hypothetical protein